MTYTVLEWCSVLRWILTASTLHVKADIAITTICQYYKPTYYFKTISFHLLTLKSLINLTKQNKFQLQKLPKSEFQFSKSTILNCKLPNKLKKKQIIHLNILWQRENILSLVEKSLEFSKNNQIKNKLKSVRK